MGSSKVPLGVELPGHLQIDTARHDDLPGPLLRHHMVERLGYVEDSIENGWFIMVYNGL